MQFGLDTALDTDHTMASRALVLDILAAFHAEGNKTAAT